MGKRFELGTTVMTAGVFTKISFDFVIKCVKRHASGDWGEVCEEDKLLNDNAVNNGERIMSVYTDDEGQKVWIITEWDRSTTTVLLPEEY